MVASFVASKLEGRAWKFTSKPITSSILWVGISKCAVGMSITIFGTEAPPTLNTRSIEFVTTFTAVARSSNKSALVPVVAVLEEVPEFKWQVKLPETFLVPVTFPRG